MGIDFNPNRLSEAFQKQLQANKRVSGPNGAQEQQASAQVGAQQAFANAALQFGQQFQSPTELSGAQRVGGAQGSQGAGAAQFQPQQTNPFQTQGTQFPSQAVQSPGQVDPMDSFKKIDISQPKNVDGNFGPANYAQQNPYQSAAGQPNGTKLWAMA